MVECMRSIVAAGIGGMMEKVKYKSIHASIHRRLSGGFFLPVRHKKMAPCAVMRQGALSVQDFLRSLVIPFVAEISGQKSRK